MIGLCRLCASLKKPDVLITIQDESNEIYEKLQKCCQLFIRVTDALPKKFCQECLDCLNKSYKFYVKVKEAQETLEAFYPSQSVEHGGAKHGESASVSTEKAGTVVVTSVKTIKSVNEPKPPSKCAKKMGSRCNNVKTDNLKSAKTDIIANVDSIICNANLSEDTKGNGNPLPRNLKNAENVKDTITIVHNEEQRKPLEETLNNPTKKNIISNSEVIDKLTKKSRRIAITDSGDNDEYLEEVYNLLGMTRDDICEEQIQLQNNPENELPNVGEEEVVVQHTHSMGEEDLVGPHITDEVESNQFMVAETQKNDQTLMKLEKENQLEMSVEDGEKIENLENEESNSKKEFSTLPPHLQISLWKSYKYLCYACEYISPSVIDLFYHANSRHSVENLTQLQYKCFDCQKVIIHYSAFLNHVRLRHHPALKLRCDACDNLCDDFEQFEIHRKNICPQAKHYPEVLPCMYCCKNFNSSYGLQAHTKQNHTMGQSSKTKFKCHECNKEFRWEKSLKNHELIHTTVSEKEDYVCDHCNKRFHTKYNLEAHVYTHSSEKLFKCHICNRSFKTGIILQKHQTIHTNMKPFKCQFCEKDFRTKIEKITHERTHTGEAPLQCTHCGKRFRFRSALSAHLKTHSGVREHECQYCPKKFNDISNFKKHVKRKHPEQEKL